MENNNSCLISINNENECSLTKEKGESSVVQAKMTALLTEEMLWNQVRKTGEECLVNPTVVWSPFGIGKCQIQEWESLFWEKVFPEEFETAWGSGSREIVPKPASIVWFEEFLGREWHPELRRKMPIVKLWVRKGRYVYEKRRTMTIIDTQGKDPLKEPVIWGERELWLHAGEWEGAVTLSSLFFIESLCWQTRKMKLVNCLFYDWHCDQVTEFLDPLTDWDRLSVPMADFGGNFL